ncbi:MAG: MarC family protein [Phycisphaerae bacterium]|nr:MarC family protein [Phycisphaerae bacterium]
MSILSAAMTLFLVMDPVGNVPMFAGLLKNVERRRWSWVIFRENVIALVTMLSFLFLGPTLMGLLHIEEPALNVAGGIVLLIIALRMIFPRRDLGAPEGDEGEPLIVPLAIPLIAGPSIMAVIMLMATRAPEQRMLCLGALLLAWAAGLLILLSAGRLQRLLGRRGLIATERLMGMILVVVAVQMAMSGIERFLNHVH